jgi:hypothetical protein
MRRAEKKSSNLETVGCFYFRLVHANHSRHNVTMNRRLLFWIFSLLLSVVAQFAIAQTNSPALQIRFLDSATGFGVPAKISVQSANKLVQEFSANSTGRAALDLASGDYTISISSTNHLPMSTTISVGETNPHVQFALDPISQPVEIQPQTVIAAHRANATIFTGFVSSEISGQGLPGVRVSSFPSQVETTTDARGFFQLAVPLQSDEERKISPAKLVFSRIGFETQERPNLDLAPFGDLVLRIEMKVASGTKIVGEKSGDVSTSTTPFPQTVQTESQSGFSISSINPTNSTVRLPTNIRVLLSDNVTVEYVSMETYVQRSLNDEWISSWGNISGGINSLKAGAVAIRSYAASYVRSPRGSTYDICATTSCQVYDSDTATVTTTAAMETAGYVVLDSNNAIARSEYSAENNSDGFSCGDGYTQPTGGCLYDPVCAGEVRFGHGRGMCQWGTARWATGRKMAGRSSGDTTPNGFPKQDWIWIVQHYYPTLTLVQAKPFVVGDDVKTVSTTNARQCPGGGIESGVNCAVVAAKAAGSTGTIIGGPVLATSDGNGYTWWQIQWSDGVVGWSVENYLERIVPVPSAPTGLNATAISSAQVNLSWIDNVDFENGFRIERAPSASGPWLQIAETAANVTLFSDTNVTAGNTFYYRVRSFNVTGTSAYSNTDSATTPGIAPALANITNKSVTEGNLLTITASATASDIVQTIADFEGFDTETASGTVLFRAPTFSGSTSANIDSSPEYSSVTTLFPSGTGLGTKVLFVNCAFTNATGAWLRLSTASTANIPNPVIDFRKKFQFRIYSDKAIAVGLGLRETVTASTTPIGSDGGTSGSSIEWVGVTNKNGAAPMPVRTVPANVWTTLRFDLPNEPVVRFSGGNGILSTASGLGVLEHLAIVPLGGTGNYKMFFDNFAVLKPRALSFSLDSGAPANATIDAATGVFSWTPTEAQGPASYRITIRVTDDSSPALSSTGAFTAAVLETNSAPVLASVPTQIVYAGNTLVVTNMATDSDLPANLLTFSLVSSPAGATIGANDGVFSWTTSDADSNTTNSVSVRVSDNGAPQLSDTNSFLIMVFPKPTLQSVTAQDGSIQFNWNAIPGHSYHLQFKNDLNEAAWTDLQTITAESTTENFSETIVDTQRFYRLVTE